MFGKFMLKGRKAHITLFRHLCQCEFGASKLFLKQLKGIVFRMRIREVLLAAGEYEVAQLDDLCNHSDGFLWSNGWSLHTWALSLSVNSSK